MQPTGKTRLIISLFIPTLDLFTLSISLQLHPVGSSKLGHVLMLLFDVLICWLFPAKRYAFLSIFMCYAPIIYFLVITAPGYGAFSTVWILNDVQLLITMIVRSQSNADTYNLPCSITKIEFSYQMWWQRNQCRTITYIRPSRRRKKIKRAQWIRGIMTPLVLCQLSLAIKHRNILSILRKETEYSSMNVISSWKYFFPWEYQVSIITLI